MALQRFSYAGHTLTWEEHRPGKETIVFINGYSANQASWIPTINDIGDLGRCVTLDLPGHYPAQAPEPYERLTQEEFLELETAAVRHIAGDRPVSLIGHSAGGMAVVGIAAKLGDQVRRVVAMSAAITGPLTGVLGSYQRMLHNLGNLVGFQLYKNSYLVPKVSPKMMQWTLANFYSGGAEHYLQSVEHLEGEELMYQALLNTNFHNLAVLLRMLEDNDLRPLVPQVTAPTLVVVGARDPIVKPENSRWLAANLRHAKLLELAHAGHVPQWEGRATLKPAIREWLSQ